LLSALRCPTTRRILRWASEKGRAMPVTWVSMTGLNANDVGAQSFSSSYEFRWVSKKPKPGEKPRSILATVQLNEMSPLQPLTVGGENAFDVVVFSLAGVWIIGYDSVEDGPESFPNGLKWAYVPHCKAVTFDIDASQIHTARGVGRLDFFD
jgi:hypothetical protein